MHANTAMTSKNPVTGVEKQACARTLEEENRLGTKGNTTNG